MDLETLERKLKAGKDIEAILAEYNWKEFEQIVAQILEEHGFSVKKNVRFTLKRKKKRMEVDVVAIRFDEILCVDCKKWGLRAGKTAALKKAAALQQERAKEYKRHFKKQRFKVYPILTTLMEEDVIIFDKIPVVPIWKLNEFVNDFHEVSHGLKRV